MLQFTIWEAKTGSFRKGAGPNLLKILLSLKENSKLHETWDHGEREWHVRPYIRDRELNMEELKQVRSN